MKIFQTEMTGSLVGNICVEPSDTGLRGFPHSGIALDQLLVDCRRLALKDCGIVAYSESFIPIPREFWSFETGMPFKRCSVCERSLLENGVEHFIEKAIEKDEVIFEYAICGECREGLMREISETSLKLIQNYFAEHIDFAHRTEQLASSDPQDYRAWISRCLVKGNPRNELDKYQLYGYCIGEEMILCEAPYLISGEAIDDIIKLLSDQTLGFLNDFTERLFGIDMPKDIILF